MNFIQFRLIIKILLVIVSFLLYLKIKKEQNEKNEIKINHNLIKNCLCNDSNWDILYKFANETENKNCKWSLYHIDTSHHCYIRYFKYVDDCSLNKYSIGDTVKIKYTHKNGIDTLIFNSILNYKIKEY